MSVAGGGYALAVSPTQLSARQHVGGPNEPSLQFQFVAPLDLAGRGLPPDLTNATFDGAIAELELPLGGSTDENAMSSAGLVSFEAPRFCVVDSVGCTAAAEDGYWVAEVTGLDGKIRAVQLAMSELDTITQKALVTTFGVYLPIGDRIARGETLSLRYRGKVTGRATDWTDSPFLAHFRYRATDWVLLDDNEVQPIQITADTMPKFVHALAPLDVAAGAQFTVAVVVTDHYGNPKPITGSVTLSGGVNEEVQLNNEWRKEITASYATPGSYKIVPQLAGARGLYHYTQVWAGTPPLQRLVGDLHSHSGDGGAQRKFIGTFIAGDHRALYTRTRDQLRYQHEVAGLDFAAVTEHAVRWDAYTPPAAVAADAEFQTGGKCAGAGSPIATLGGDWFTPHQKIVQQADSAEFVTFPAYEWHCTHTQKADRSPLHRIVLFRDFATTTPLPLLPGDVENVAPQCIVRFLSLSNFGPDKALVIPHMMQASDTNIDWDLTYADSTVAPRAQTDSYYRVGEIYSARAIDQGRAYGSATLSVFERADVTGGRWAYRYGWRWYGAHIGVIGSSDNHEQMAGVNDDVDLDGVNYHSNEPGGYAVVLSPTKDRGGIFSALSSRATYATSGIRAWLDFHLEDTPMGGQTSRTAATSASIAIMAGMSISTVELWSAPVGMNVNAGYTLVGSATPNDETFSMSIPVANPVAAGGGTQEWLYYVRAYFKAPGSTVDADEALWSSPIWVSWTN
jgi:hypothetical protein